MSTADQAPIPRGHLHSLVCTTIENLTALCTEIESEWQTISTETTKLNHREEDLAKREAALQQALAVLGTPAAPVTTTTTASRQASPGTNAPEAPGPLPTDRVVLNVGGTKFETTRDTLASEPDSFLATMVSWPPDRNGEYFIDRDPRFFSEILNYLRAGRRDGKLKVGLSPSDRKELTELIDYLCIDSLRGFRGQAPTARIRSQTKQTQVYFVGFARWSLADKASEATQDALMDTAAWEHCRYRFYNKQETDFFRAATLAEFQSGAIHGFPPRDEQLGLARVPPRRAQPEAHVLTFTGTDLSTDPRRPAVTLPTAFPPKKDIPWKYYSSRNYYTFYCVVVSNRSDPHS